jgi:tetratricopeptide (TPR) repeat protein
MELPLRDYLGGHVLRKAMLLFEDAVGPWVKAEVEAHFNRKLVIAPDDDDHSAAEDDATIEAHGDDVAKLVTRRDELVQLIRTGPKEERQAVAQERKSIDEQLKQLCAVPTPAAPVPRWIEECRVFFGSTMKQHVNASNHWDVHTIVAVMRGVLRDVFARHLPDHFHAKELLSGILRVLSMRSTRAHRVAMVESDVLGALQQMVSVMTQCQRGADTVAAVAGLLDEAKGLVQRARDEGPDAVCVACPLSADDVNAQRLYMALTAWELHVEAALGLVVVGDGGTVVDASRGRLAYKDGTVVFGSGLDAERTAVVQSLKPQLHLVAMARHWYFHNLQGPCDFAGTFTAMKSAAAAIAAAATSSPWHPPAVATVAVPTKLHLHTPSVRMSVPVARVDEIVGREVTVERVTTALTAGARVLLHGLPGVGKDTVMTEVAHRPEIQSLGGLQAWLQASSDVVLRRQLIELFATHRPRVVAELENDAAAAIAAIKRWLATNSNWVLFVEDASLTSTTLWDVLTGASMDGRLLVTSQEVGIAAAQAAVFEAGSVLELEPITTDESIALLIKSNVLSKKAPAPPDGETEAELEQRCTAAGTADVYVPAPDGGERAKERKMRRKAIEARLFERTELGRPEMRLFLDDTLGNLPLTVAQVGHMLRADERLRGVLDLVAMFRQTADLAEVDRAGANPMLDKHYYGLSLSVRITLDRLRSGDGAPEVDREGALALLAMLSLLNRAQTPVSLLSGHDALVGAVQQVCEACRGGAGAVSRTCASAECRQGRAFSTMLSDEASLERARDVCVHHGLLQDAGEGRDGVVGVMHQLVQRCLRHELVTTSAAGKVVVGAARGILVARFTYSRMSPSEWPAMRRLAPCIQAWADLVCGRCGDGAAGEGAEVAAVPEDGELLSKWDALLSADGDAKAAERAAGMDLALQRRMLPFDHPRIATSMSNLASTYSDLGRHQDALKMKEDTLEFQRRVLPPDHPDIGLSMSNLAATYFDLGRHADALKMQENVLAFQARVLPCDPQPIATSMNNIASTYSALGRHNDALKMNEHALALIRQVLPTDHPDIAVSMSNLATTYYDLGRFQDAHKMNEDTLKFRRRVLPPDHPDIGLSMSNLAATYFDLGWHADALKMQENVLVFHRRVLPPDHPRIGSSMNNLAKTYSDLGRPEDALKMNGDALEFRRRVLPSDHPDIARSMNNLAKTYSDLGRHEDALKMMEDVLAFHRRVLPSDHPNIAISMFNIGYTVFQLDDVAKSIHYLQGAVDILERAGYAADHPHVVRIRQQLDCVRSIPTRTGQLAQP